MSLEEGFGQHLAEAGFGQSLSGAAFGGVVEEPRNACAEVMASNATHSNAQQNAENQCELFALD
ncbi:MAG: hypothetical protein VX554_04605, partial [Candidatus Thermoplasmatota archaeon]|nr:hypothetical protein [Candidatus Thermoplasmatota archaeon]